MRGAWVEIIIIGTHTLRAPSPLTAASTLTKSKVCAGHQFVRNAAHTQRKPNGRVLCPRVTQAAMIAAASFGLRRSGTFCDGNIGSGLLGRISEAWPALAPPGECS